MGEAEAGQDGGGSVNPNVNRHGPEHHFLAYEYRPVQHRPHQQTDAEVHSRPLFRNDDQRRRSLLLKRVILLIESYYCSMASNNFIGNETTNTEGALHGILQQGDRNASTPHQERLRVELH